VRVRALRRWQAVTAEFGRYVLREVDLTAVLAEAVRVCAEGLKAPFCKVYRYRPAQDDLVREAGYGWCAGVKERLVLRADATSPEGRAFVTRQPVICNASRESIGSDRPQWCITRPSDSTVDVIIKGVDGKPYGLLGASNGAQQAYDQNDVEFLSGIANILAGAIARFERMGISNQVVERSEAATGKSNQQLERAHVSGEVPPPRGPHSNQAVNSKQGNAIPGAVAKIAIGGIKAKAPVIRSTTALSGRLPGRTTIYAPSRRLLIVEDDEVFREILLELFAAEGGFTVFTAGTLAEADQALIENNRYFDTILLDVRVPDGDGCEYCAKLRHERHEMPIIMLTGANEEVDVIRGLDSGADDYIAKPFRWNELLARLRAHLRLLDSSEASILAIGPYLFRPAKKLLEDRGGKRRIMLTNMEGAVLRFLYHRSPAVVDRQILANEVWGPNSRVTTHTLETHIYRLRQKMEANPASPALLLSERGGYRLNLATVAA
jgi:DNA-binding response OmpR family regulator